MGGHKTRPYNGDYMKKYIIRRVFISLIVLIGISIIMYALIRLMPGDYVTAMAASNPQMPPEAVENLHKLYGTFTNPVEGYITWASNVLKGDFGDSFLYRQPVNEVIASKMWISFWLAFIAFVLELVIAIPLGVMSATKQYSKLDYSMTTFAIIGISMPTFFFAAILQRVFAYGLRILPPSGMITARADYEGIWYLLDVGYHFILPTILLVILGIGSLMRFTRTNMLEVMHSDFIRTARAKGLSEKDVIYKHGFRNTLIPIVTMVGGTLPGLFSGAIITESIFAIDGIGRTAYKALMVGDIPFIMGFNMFLAVLTLVGTLISDILYAVVDPRIRYS